MTTYRSTRNVRRAPRGRAMIAVAFSGALLAGGGIFATTNAFAADETPSDDAIAKACSGDGSALPSGQILNTCTAQVTELGRKKKTTAVSSLFVDNCNSDNEAGIEGTGNYVQSSTWTIRGGAAGVQAGDGFVEGDVSLPVTPGLTISGGSSYSQGEESSQSITGTFPVPGRQKGQIVYSQEYADLDVTYTAVVASVSPGQDAPSNDTFTVRARAEAPVKGARGGISAEVVGCDQNFSSPVGDVKFAR
jgi:hypothetical protein